MSFSFETPPVPQEQVPRLMDDISNARIVRELKQYSLPELRSKLTAMEQYRSAIPQAEQTPNAIRRNVGEPEPQVVEVQDPLLEHEIEQERIREQIIRELITAMERGEI